jgi:hypothetical protein
MIFQRSPNVEICDVVAQRGTIMITNRIATFLFTASLLSSAHFAEATNFWKNSVLTGNWSTGNNWSATSAAGGDNAGVPTSEPVYIAFTDGAARTVTYEVAAPSVGVLSIDLTGPGVTTATLSLPGANNLATDGIIVGGSNSVALTNGRGALIQAGGTVTTSPIVGDVVVGYGAGSTGIYTLSGGSLINHLHEYIGLAGAGTFNQTGGSNSINASASGFLSVGHNAGATGTYNLGGVGALMVATPEYIGYMGTGSFTQSGGSSHTISGGKSLYLGYLTGSSGSYTLSNTGTLAVSGPQYVGYDGMGTFTQSGGSNGTGAQNLNVGFNAGSTGTYTLSGGTLTPGFQSIVGLNGNGVFVQTGGVHTVNLGFLAIAHGANSVSSYALSGGAVTSASGTSVGAAGAGTFNQSGGTHTANGGLYLGSSAGSSGAYTLSAGSLIVNGVSSIGANNFGAGTFNHTGGTHTVSTTLRVGEGVGAAGAYNLSGTGVLSTDAQHIGDRGAGTFNQNGGTNTVYSLRIGHQAGSMGAYTLSAGTLTATGVMELATVGYNGTGSFSQTGGSHTNIGGLMIGRNVGSNGAYTLSNGSLSGGPQWVGYEGTGTFNQSGGSNSTNSDLFIGKQPTGIGTYTLIAGVLSSGGNQTIGADGGTGTFNQSGGTNIANQQLQLGYSVGAVGNYNLSGGTLTTMGAESVGFNGTGNFNQSGGTHVVETRLDLAFGLQSSGVYTLSAGSLVANADEFVGQQGAGTFNHSGGTNFVGDELVLAHSSASTGVYNLSGTGALVVQASEYIGSDGTGQFTQTGGTNVVGENLFIGYLSGSVGGYALSAGAATVAGSALIGLGPGNGTGHLTVNGAGTLTVGGTFAVNTGSSVDFSAGVINAAALDFAGTPSLFNWTGGTLNLTSNITWDSAAAASTSRAFGTSLAVGANKTLVVSGNETLGGAGVFSLTLNSGGIHHVTGALTIDPAGTLTLSAGSTLVAGSIVQAGGAINGTLRSEASFVHQSGLFTGRLVNLGVASISGLNFTTGNGVENDGSMTVAAGQTLIVNGAGLDNVGMFTLVGGALSGSGPVLNNYGGTLHGRGTINSPLTNNGVLEVDGVLRFNAPATNNGIVRGSGTMIGAFANAAGGTLAVGSGELLAISNAWTNSGLTTLAGSGVLGGGAITNTGTIQGAGTINSPIANSGVIRAAGGELDLGAAGVTNATGGLIQAATGNMVMVLQGLAANAGTIAVTGGAFDNNYRPLTNLGVINGYGVIRTSTLTNTNKLNVGEGNMDVFGAVVNNGTIGLQGGRSIFFFGGVSGPGNYTGAGTAVFLADVSPGNSPAAVTFSGNVTLASSSTLLVELGGTVRGSEYDAILAAGNLTLGGALAVSFIDAGDGVFAPAEGDAFDLLDWGSLTGTFSSISLPPLNGLRWDTSQLYSNGVLSVVAAFLEADFNESGMVNGADLTPWKSGFGTSITAAHDQGDADGDQDVDGGDFLLWQRQLGMSSPLPSATNVPEPATLLLVTVAWFAIARSGARAHPHF